MLCDRQSSFDWLREGFDLLTTRVGDGGDKRNRRDEDKAMAQEEKAIGTWEEKGER